MSWRVSQKRVVIWGEMMSTAGLGRDHVRRRPSSMASRAAKHTHHQTWGTRGGEVGGGKPSQRLDGVSGGADIGRKGLRQRERRSRRWEAIGQVQKECMVGETPTEGQQGHDQGRMRDPGMLWLAMFHRVSLSLQGMGREARWPKKERRDDSASWEGGRERASWRKERRRLVRCWRRGRDSKWVRRATDGGGRRGYSVEVWGLSGSGFCQDNVGRMWASSGWFGVRR